MALALTSVETSTGEVVCGCTRLATSFVSRLVGLLNRSELGADEGLLLVPGGSVHTFGMRFDIDIVFLSTTWKILGTTSYVRPWRSRRAPRGTKAVLELPAGRVERLALMAGMQLLLHEQP